MTIDAKRLVFLGFLDEGKVDCIENVELIKGGTPADVERIEFWEMPPANEIMEHRTIGEAIEDWFELLIDHEAQDLKVQGYARMEPTIQRGSTVEWILEWLDGEYGDPDGNDVTEPNKDMLTAEAKLHETILQGYESWACEPVIAVTINLVKWRGDP